MSGIGGDFFSFIERLPLEELRGLSPRAWVCVGPGFVREDIKARVLERNGSFVAEAVTTVQEVCIRLVNATGAIGATGSGRIAPDRILNTHARQEGLRLLLAEPRISAPLQELKRLRRQATFFRKLDTAIQSGRLAFAHEEEEAVLNDKLRMSVGPSALRDEIRALSGAYETWLGASGLWDPVTLLRAGLAILAEGWPERLRKPEKIVHVTAQIPEGLETQFWEALGHWVSVERVGPVASRQPDGVSDSEIGKAPLSWAWQRWHTLDDAAEALAEELANAAAEWSQSAVLIPDLPAIRRSLLRALCSRGLPLADPRDPGRLRWDESVKLALLPLKVTAGGFERDSVLSWIRSWPSNYPPETAALLAKQIGARGIRAGLRSYAPFEELEGGRGSRATAVAAMESWRLLHRELTELDRRFGGKRTAYALGEAHLEWLREAAVGCQDLAAIADFFEGFWRQFVTDLGRVGLGGRRAAALYWVQRLESRLRDAAPPVERLKPATGIRIFRLQQAPLESAPVRLFLFGMPAQWLSSEAGDYWFNSREREILASEFAVRSSRQIKEERLAVLQSWLRQAATATVLDADYGEDGRERESLEALLGLLGCPLEKPEIRGSHPRWSRSYDAIRPVPAQVIELPPLAPREPGKKPVVAATALDRYSRCAFQGLALQRWKLWDLRDPGFDLWPEVRGTILHEAVKHLLRSRDAEGQFGVLPREAIDRAWSENPPQGFFRSKRSEEYEKLRAVLVLEAFCAAERTFFQRAGTRTVSLEELKLEVEYPEFVLVGEPDRIEEHPDGLFVSDFKTSSAQPTGTDMVELGYRLQLPFYAIGVQRQTGRPVLGVQFIELGRSGKRSSGIFFERWNGKDAGKLTQLRAGMKSLFKREPDDLWAEVEAKVLEHARAYVGGKYSVGPKKEAECRGCAAADLCGMRRLNASGLKPASLDTTSNGEAEEGGGA